MPEAKEESRFVEMIFPEQTNHYWTLFDGNGLALVSKAAFVAATRRAVVKAASERVDFDVPVRLGDLVAPVERSAAAR